MYFMLLGVLLSTAVMADNKQTVTIDGSQVSKTVKEITFNGDNVGSPDKSGGKFFNSI